MRFSNQLGKCQIGGMRPAAFVLCAVVLLSVLAHHSLVALGDAGTAPVSKSANVQISITVTSPDENGSGNDLFRLLPLIILSEGEPGKSVSQGLTLTSLSKSKLLFTAGAISPILNKVGADDLSCAAWSKVSPASFSLAPPASRALALQYTIPKNLSKIPYFFGRIRIVAADALGKPAGTLERLVIIHNKKATTGPQLTCLSFSCGAVLGRAKLLVTCVNIGSQGLTPAAQGYLRDPTGRQPARSIPLSAAPNPVPPLCELNLAGTLGLDNVADGDYELLVTCSYERGSLTLSAPARVSTGPAGKAIAIVGPIESANLPAP